MNRNGKCETGSAHTKNNVDRVCFGGVFPLTAHLCRSTFHEKKKNATNVCPVVTLLVAVAEVESTDAINPLGLQEKIHKKKLDIFLEILLASELVNRLVCV